MNVLSIQSPFWTTEEAAAYCRVSLTTLQELLRQGAIPGHRVGRQWRILKADLDRYLGLTPDGTDRKIR
ncbi:MAG TPA: helix-turn-helix domain-containing protein [Chloroflexota bacterium]|nr:helix-turn-helix domain-containing protein [Chloroflexota bacterium]